MFSPEQITALQSPLEPTRVKQRRQGGRLISYLEGYDVIDHANSIFGFDGWNYALQDVQFVRMGEACFYHATVRVWLAGVEGSHRDQVPMGPVERTDVGVCDVAYARDRGIDGATADALATALKGAVTDGLKRALRSFGSQFGNSLYDKDDPAHEVAIRDGYPREPCSLGYPSPDQAGDGPACHGCGGATTLRSGTTRDGRPYSAWFCSAKCGQKPVWINERKAS